MTAKAHRHAHRVLAFLLLSVAIPVTAQDPDTAAIRQAAEDYILGWYEGDADRMARALHPELVKRLHLTHPQVERSWVQTQGKSQLVLSTAAGGGTRTPPEDQRAEVTILDVFRGAAVVRVDADDWVDYLQLVEEDGRWLILNVLWEVREPQPGTGVG